MPWLLIALNTVLAALIGYAVGRRETARRYERFMHENKVMI